MGTNYYITESCPCCGREDEPKHLGKSSAGWCFALHVYPDEGINDLSDWEKLWEGKTIIDEYGDWINTKQMRDIITNREGNDKQEKNPFGYKSWVEFHRLNQSELGPNNLIRRQVDSYHCIGHGDGTWDLIVGEFS